MTISPSDAARAAARPFVPSDTLRRLNLTDADGAISLAAGVYTIVLDATSTAILKVDNAAVVPTSGAAETTGAALLPGAAFDLTLEAAAALHGIMVTASATGILWIHRKVL